MRKPKPIQWNFPMRLYILMRNDLPSMNAGKAMAQAAHAANQFIYQFGDKVQVKHWQNEAKPFGFGTTIVLSVNQYQLRNCIQIAKEHYKNVPSGLVYDDTYPFVVTKEIYQFISATYITAPHIEKDDGTVVAFRQEVTCGFVFVGADSSDKTDLVGEFPLYP